MRHAPTPPGRLLRAAVAFGALWLAGVLASGGCSPPTPPATSGPLGSPGPAQREATSPEAGAGAAGARDAGHDGSASAHAPCPSGMVHVRHDFCPEMERFCLKNEYDKSNHISICHRFKEGAQTCKAKRVPLNFCIDTYEYPNKKGARPPVMVDWYDAMGLCAAQGKRLCYESEWVSACEGPDEKPFPYGYARSADKCNIDNRWINPSLKKIYSDDPEISKPELDRLWQGVMSGEKPDCVSDYGVFDLTGNVDEWAMADRDRPEERAVFAALKGGAWGHVRNACRPVTTSHEPEFRYYFVSFRCCQDAAVQPAATD